MAKEQSVTTERSVPARTRKDRLAWSEGDARDALARYEGAVRTIARRLRPVAALGQALDEDDLRAEGRVAVLEALSSYQGFGIAEQTWVRTRIRQRMIDAIRRMDLRSRDEMRLAVRHSAGETAGTAEEERGRVIAARRLVSLDAAPAELEPMINRLPDPQTHRPDDATQQRGRCNQLRDAMTQLPSRQREALHMGLFDGMALREIGSRMGISESRVCQLQKRAVQHLRKAVTDHRPSDDAA